jgi:hypothetical protein
MSSGGSETLSSTGGTSGAGGTTGSGGDVAGGNGGSSGSAQGGSTPLTDSGSAHRDAGGGRDTSDAAVPAPDSAADAAPSCTTDVAWYQDEDADGYGSTVSVTACPKPAGRWVLADGDCNDQDARVNPGQTKYFGAPYLQSDNTDSFDYDCSGVEEPNPDLTVAPEDCGPLKLALCGTATGYETNNRLGLGINPWCGSTTVRVCVPSLLLCTTTEHTGQQPFACR